jgi:hypothetical protein
LVRKLLYKNSYSDAMTMLYLLTMSVKRLLFSLILLILLGLLAVPVAAWAGEAVQVVQTVTSTWTATGTLTPDDSLSTPVVTTTPGLEDINTATPQPTPTVIPTPTPTPIPIVPETGLPLVLPLFNGDLPDDGYGPKDYPVYINPLTGLPVPDPALLDRRPIAVKITNLR